MRYWTRKGGSQRTSQLQSIQLEPNFSGQGGYDYMAFRDERGVYHVIQPETLAEVRELQSQAAILAHNVKDD